LIEALREAQGVTNRSQRILEDTVAEEQSPSFIIRFEKVIVHVGLTILEKAFTEEP
jgi:hypothetical protein